MILRDTLASEQRPSMVTIDGKPYFCTPTATVPDDGGMKFLAHMEKQGITRFERGATAPQSPVKETFRCDVCGKECTSKAGLGSHKRKHKEKT